MEKQTSHRSKGNKILKLIPKAAQAAAVSFQNPPFSPGWDKRYDVKTKTPLGKVFSGPIFSMIPAEARGRSRNNYETQEPTSPKVSCIGQVRHKNAMCRKNQGKESVKPVRSKPDRVIKSARTESPAPAPELKKKPSGIKRIFGSRRKSDACVDHCKPPLTDRPAPSLSQMRRFASSRDTLADFDWTSSTGRVTTPDRGGFCSDDDRGFSDGEVDVSIPFSAPILVAGDGLVAQPRKEINLWKRRTMAQPKPLQLNLIRA